MAYRYSKRWRTKVSIGTLMRSDFLLSTKWRVTCALGASCLILITILSIPKHAETKQPPSFTLQSLYHFTGGFSIDSPLKVVNAAENGIEVDLKYGDPYTPQDPVGTALQTKHMRLIDAIPQTYLYYYECYIHKTCPADDYTTSANLKLTSTQALLTAVAAHLQQVRQNPLIIGYWVLDDWPFPEDYGGAKDILIQINRLIHFITPARPSICGFGGSIWPLPQQKYDWSDGVAANFSSQGCDMVGLYIYGEAYTQGTYDWTMSDILPAIFASLLKRGWDMQKEPFIGIPQAFGGNLGEPFPFATAASIEAQTAAFCQHGATGIVYYAWDNSGTDTTTQFPWNSQSITQGVRNGIAACKRVWAGQFPTMPL